MGRNGVPGLLVSTLAPGSAQLKYCGGISVDGDHCRGMGMHWTYY